MLLRSALLAVAVLALAACGGGGSTTSTQGQSLLPPGCSADQAHAIVTDFLEHPSVAPAGWFTSYRSDESDGRSYGTSSRAAAVAHMKARLKLGERDRVIQLQVYPVDINHVHVVFTMTRSAPDFRKRGINFRIATGDGTVDCAHGKVAEWSQTGP